MSLSWVENLHAPTGPSTVQPKCMVCGRVGCTASDRYGTPPAMFVPPPWAFSLLHDMRYP